jgi:hypothetical protein
MTKTDETHPFSLCKPREVGDRNPDQSKDRGDVVQFQRVDDEMKPVGRLGRLLCRSLFYCLPVGFCHGAAPWSRDVMDSS